ncbi:MAG: large subunit ribosomal protein L28 [Candidatus Promineifilaceae bacterium]|jgi:large subunit ribosomal protein L28
MAKSCDLCGKGSQFGSSIVRHGMEKKKGGIGLHITGVSKRQFRPNVQRVRMVENGSVVRRYACTTCIKSGKVIKP